MNAAEIYGHGPRADAIKVTLAKKAMEHVAQVGALANVRALTMDLPIGYDSITGDEPWAAHIEGAAAEYVVGRAFDLRWYAEEPEYRFTRDVGNVEVRRSQYPNGRLVVQEKDNDAQRIVLVTGSMPTFFICGWAWVSEAKQARYWLDRGAPLPWNPKKECRREGWFLPQCDLRSIRAFDAAAQPGERFQYA